MGIRSGTQTVLLLATLAVLSSSLPGCGGDREISFGPEATIRAFDIVPGCESLTPNGEFSTTIDVTVGIGILDDEELLSLNRLALGDGDTATRSVDLTMEVDTGDDVCVESDDTEEIDELLNDDLSEDEDCHEIRADSDRLDFMLEMTAGSCILQIEVPATVSAE